MTGAVALARVVLWVCRPERQPVAERHRRQAKEAHRRRERAYGMPLKHGSGVIAITGWEIPALRLSSPEFCRESKEMPCRRSGSLAFRRQGECRSLDMATVPHPLPYFF